MRIQIKLSLVLIVISLVAIACQPHTIKDNSKVITSEIPKKLNTCKEPRPEICTREYKPVCGYVDTGVRCVKAPCASDMKKTYSNACTACSDIKVYGYTLNDCPK